MLVTIAYTGLRWGEAIGLERDYAPPGEIHVEWQLRELRGRFHRLPPKDDSYRSTPGSPACRSTSRPSWPGCSPTRSRPPTEACACVPEHGGSGRYVFRSPDGGHYRRSNYGRRVFRPACDGRIDASNQPPAASSSPTPPPGPASRSHPPAQPGATLQPAARERHPAIPDGTPLACWLPVKPGLTTHGLRHGHKTWMAEDGIPEILSEQRLGHEVPGMRGLYAHASDRMRDELKAALQARWEDPSGSAPPSTPTPPCRSSTNSSPHSATRPKQPTQKHSARPHSRPQHQPPDREKMISQIPPNKREDPAPETGTEAFKTSI